LGAAAYLNFFERGFPLLLAAFVMVIIMLILWWRDVVREGTFNLHHTTNVQKGLRLGMILFIVSEVLFFFAFFRAFFHSALAPTHAIGCQWPPAGMEVFNPFEIPLLNTCLLLTSGATITVAHHALLSNNKSDVHNA
jgi:heme/copper-type cytochrome/quinol oxidase subunit 3